MSAYICDLEHINYLVQAAQALDLSWVWNVDRRAGTYEHESLRGGDHAQETRIGQMLHHENILSVNYRYGKTNPEQIFTPTIFWGRLDPIQVIKSCHCYSYQACEHPEWEESKAYAFVKALEGMAIRRIAGYDAAEWGAPKKQVAA